MGLPCTSTSPEVGSSKPAIMRRLVVLPQPDGPSIEKNSPSRICIVTLLTAVTSSPVGPGNCLTTLCSSTAYSAMHVLRVSGTGSFYGVREGMSNQACRPGVFTDSAFNRTCAPVSLAYAARPYGAAASDV